MTATPTARPTPTKTGSAHVLDEQERRMNMEIDQLLIDIRRIGPTHPDPSPNVLFGELFDDDRVQQFYEALVGTLKCAKKRGVVNFRGQMLLKGIHDETLISIVGEQGSLEDHLDSSVSRSICMERTGPISAFAVRKSNRRITPRILTPKVTTPLVQTPTTYSESERLTNKRTNSSGKKISKNPMYQQSKKKFAPKRFTFASPPPAEMTVKVNEKLEPMNSSLHTKKINSNLSMHCEKTNICGTESGILENNESSLISSDTPDQISTVAEHCETGGIQRELSHEPDGLITSFTTGLQKQISTKLSIRKTTESRCNDGPQSERDIILASKKKIHNIRRETSFGLQNNQQNGSSVRPPKFLSRSASMPSRKVISKSQTLILCHSHDIASRTEDEIHRIVDDIRRVGCNPGEPSVKFGELFEDEKVQNTYEALVGTLRSAKKQGLIAFKGQMLLKGMHDHVVISVVE